MRRTGVQLAKDITTEATESVDYAIIVALDIRNAFNSIPWPVIRRTLRHKGYPEYIKRLIDSYLSDRVINYVEKNGAQCERPMEAGAPMFGDTWSRVVEYCDSVLGLAENEEHCNIVCYADDTLVIVTGLNLLHTRLRASVFIGKVIDHISRLGLTVATDKTEAIIFHPKEWKL